MANQRSATKRKLNAWVEDTQFQALTQRQKELGFETLTEFLVFVSDANKSVVAPIAAPAKKNPKSSR